MKVAGNIIEVLKTAEIENNILRLTCGQLNRKDYVETNKVLEAIGGKWNKKEKGHIFEDDPTDKLESILCDGEYLDKKKELGFFETPSNLIRRLIELAEIKAGQLVLEPSAGLGAIAKEVSKITTIDCVEIDMDHINKWCCDSIARNIWHVNFLEMEPENYLGVVYDRVIMNPPFADQQDIKHVIHALKFMKNGGRLVAIMSPGFTFRENKLSLDFKKMFLEHGGYLEQNPENSFKGSGTCVNSVTVVINKIANRRIEKATQQLRMEL